MKRTLVQDVMTRRVIAVAEDAPFKVVLLAMRLNRVNALPVLNAAGEVRGIVSAADLVLKEVKGLTDDRNPLALPHRRRDRRKAIAEKASQLMTAPAHTIGTQGTVMEAAERMRALQVAQLPVLDEKTGRLVGIVTRSDLLRVYARTDTEIRAEIIGEVAGPIAGVAPRSLTVAVDQGIVSLHGTVRDRAAARELVRAVERVEGVVRVDERLERVSDERYPAAPLNW